MTDPLTTLRDAYRFSHRREEADAALAQVETLIQAISAWDADLSDACDGPLRDAVHQALAPFHQQHTMRHRYDILRIWTDRYGQKFYEVADHQMGVIYWTKTLPA